MTEPNDFKPMLSDEEIDQRMRYHAPTPLAVHHHGKVTEGCIALARILVRSVPSSRGLSLAITALEQCRMHANQGIALNHDSLPE